MVKPSKKITLERLEEILQRIPALEQLSLDSPLFEKWRRDAKTALTYSFGEESSQVQDFTKIRYTPMAIPLDGARSRISFQKAYLSGLTSANAIFSSMIDEVKEYWEDDQTFSNLDTEVHHEIGTNQVFVVHGQDEGTKDTVARVLKELDLDPIVLHEQPSEGRTIIEKFERYAQVGFAIVLLMPDDKCDSSFRARQNVIFELGYFIGKLGRSRTCALFREGVEMPSDYDGVLYIKMDEPGAWKMKLIKELQGAGFDVDANRVL